LDSFEHLQRVAERAVRAPKRPCDVGALAGTRADRGEPKAEELANLQSLIEESSRRYEKGEFSAARYRPSLARMEADEAELKRERRQYEGRQQTRRHAIANLAEEWDKPDFTMEQKQAAVAETLTAVIIKPVGRGVPFHPDRIVPIFRESDKMLL
jgi:site-specific DNA recombinase